MVLARLLSKLQRTCFCFPSHSYVRKAYELYFALLMEAMWSKERILEVYLNVVEFGPGIYGIGSRSAKLLTAFLLNQLSQWQAARLAVVLPNPYQASKCIRTLLTPTAAPIGR